LKILFYKNMTCNADEINSFYLLKNFKMAENYFHETTTSIILTCSYREGRVS